MTLCKLVLFDKPPVVLLWMHTVTGVVKGLGTWYQKFVGPHTHMRPMQILRI